MRQLAWAESHSEEAQPIRGRPWASLTNQSAYRAWPLSRNKNKVVQAVRARAGAGPRTSCLLANVSERFGNIEIAGNDDPVMQCGAQSAGNTGPMLG